MTCGDWVSHLKLRQKDSSLTYTGGLGSLHLNQKLQEMSKDRHIEYLLLAGMIVEDVMS